MSWVGAAHHAQEHFHEQADVRRGKLGLCFCLWEPPCLNS